MVFLMYVCLCDQGLVVVCIANDDRRCIVGRGEALTQGGRRASKEKKNGRGEPQLSQSHGLLTTAGLGPRAKEQHSLHHHCMAAPLFVRCTRARVAFYAKSHSCNSYLILVIISRNMGHTKTTREQLCRQAGLIERAHSCTKNMK